MLDLLQTPGVVSGILSLAIIVIVALLRQQFGETEADRLLKASQSAINRGVILMDAAYAAVTEVEKGLKKTGDLNNDELKAAAVSIAADILEAYGIKVSNETLNVLFALIERAYQQLKPGFKALPA